MKLKYAVGFDSTRTQQDLRWLIYLLQSLDLDQGTKGAAVPRLSRKAAYDREVLVPSLTEQRSIAQYLDRQLAKIDALITEKQHLLKLLAEKHRSLVTHSVTCGLNSHSVKRESGIEWLDEVPSHWPVEQLKYHLSRIEQGRLLQSDSLPADENEWGVLKVGAVNGWEFNPYENKRVSAEVDVPLDYEIKTGDVLVSRVNTTELVGSAAFVEQVRPRLLLCDKLYRLKIQSNRLLPEYLVYYLRSLVGRFVFERDATGSGGCVRNISQEILANLWIPVPPIFEQYEIVAHIKDRQARLGNLETAVKKTIELLYERRVALISAVVTGQLLIL